ncbi:MAG: hypothetical protein QM489_07940 [Candidatus Izemoplasma sp.]
MKKLFSTLIMIGILFTLSACQEDNTDLETRIALLEAEIVELKLENDGYVAEIGLLQEQIAALESEIYDNVITISLEDEFGNIDVFTIGYSDEFTGSLIELLEEEVSITYSVYDFGTMITEIGGLESQMGSYIGLKLNGQMSMVGIDDLAFNDQAVIGFELMWWDEDLHALDTAINLFIDNYASDYINTEFTDINDYIVDYNVTLALNLLGILDEYINPSDIEAMFPSETIYPTSGDYFKAIMKLSSVGANSDLQMEGLVGLAAVGGYGKTAYDLIGLNAYTHTYDFSAFEALALTDLTTVNTPYELGLDSGGISLVALSYYREETNVQSVVDEFLTWISTSQLDTGGLATRDNGWGSTENASSIAMVIIGMINWGEDPTGEDYTKGTNTLVSRLLEFQTETGSFDYDLTDEYDEDLGFSTPQAFLALVMYQQYKELYDFNVYAYNFNE